MMARQCQSGERRPASVKRPALVLALLAWCACGLSAEVSRELGARCDDHDECDERCLRAARYPGGLCSLSCDDDGDCPSSSSCADVIDGVCLFDCERGPDCQFLGTGWTCQEEAALPTGMVKVCIGPQ